jgi:hypothetical protein
MPTCSSRRRRTQEGRPRVKGKELPKPAQVVRETPKPAVLTVAWYGGERRRVEVVTGSGWWYQSGRPLIQVRGVFVRDRTGTHRDEYFFTTDVMMSPQAVIETYTGRWSIETTFQEARSYLGLETTRGWSRNTVLRAEPSLFALYTVVAWLDAELPARYRLVRGLDWLGKSDVTFSDAITAVRRWRERSISFGSCGDPCCRRKCLPLKMVPASRLVVRTQQQNGFRTFLVPVDTRPL